MKRKGKDFNVLPITNECINCHACQIECPADAIMEPVNSIRGKYNKYMFISSEHYYIDHEKCNECGQINISPCVNICPMDAIKRV